MPQKNLWSGCQKKQDDIYKLLDNVIKTGSTGRS